MSVNVLITGESHIGAIHEGVERMREQGRLPLGLNIMCKPLGGGHLLPTPFFKDAGDHVQIVNEEYRRRIPRLPLQNGNMQFHWYGFCAPLHTSRVYRDPSWAKYQLPGGNGPGIPLSRALVTRIVEDDQRYVMEMLKILKRLGLRLFAVESPRPFRHHYVVRATGEERIIAIDRFYRSTMRQWLKSHDIVVVEVPPCTYDEAGFTLDQLRSRIKDDQHHGNVEFGELMVGAIVQRLAQKEGRLTSVTA